MIWCKMGNTFLDYCSSESKRKTILLFKNSITILWSRFYIELLLPTLIRSPQQLILLMTKRKRKWSYEIDTPHIKNLFVLLSLMLWKLTCILTYHASTSILINCLSKNNLLNCNDFGIVSKLKWERWSTTTFFVPFYFWAQGLILVKVTLNELV